MYFPTLLISMFITVALIPLIKGLAVKVDAVKGDEAELAHPGHQYLAVPAVACAPARGVDVQEHQQAKQDDDDRAASRRRPRDASASTRCVAAALMTETGSDSIAVQTAGGVLSAEMRAHGLIAVDMGEARTGWRDIPLSEEADTLSLPIIEGPLSGPVAVSIGNPHCVFFVDDAEAVDLARLGPKLEHSPWYPERTNVEVATVLAKDRIRLRVWERGAGITQACGTGACATAVAARRRDLSDDTVTVTLDGGDLAIELRADGHVVMVGPVAVSFTGEIAP